MNTKYYLLRNNRSLNLNNCDEVTDIGIQWLCGIDDSGIGRD